MVICLVEMKTKERKFLKSFGEFVANTRSTLGLTQNELAILLHNVGYKKISQNAIAQIELGRVSNPSKIFLIALAKALDVDFDVVMLGLVADKYGWTPRIVGQDNLPNKFGAESLVFFVKLK